MHLSQLINLKMISHRFKYLVPLLTSFNFMSYRNTSGMGEPFLFYLFIFFFGGGGGGEPTTTAYSAISQTFGNVDNQIQKQL